MNENLTCRRPVRLGPVKHVPPVPGRFGLPAYCASLFGRSAQRCPHELNGRAL